VPAPARSPSPFPGEAFRCVVGLALGYLTRPFLKVEVLLAPMYDAVLQAVTPGAVYDVPPPTQDEVLATLNKLAVAAAAAFFVPQLLLGWGPSECGQLAGPLALGWALFDVAYMAAFLIKVRSLPP
jgi:hypothetical protein